MSDSRPTKTPAETSATATATETSPQTPAQTPEPAAKTARTAKTASTSGTAQTPGTVRAFAAALLRRPLPRPGWALRAAGLAALLAVPFYFEAFWLQLGLFVYATAVAALGLTLLLGQAGMLSMGHAFFIALGAYGYTYLASPAGEDRVGLGLPPLLALVLAVALTGVAGLLFSPVAARLRGIYLGIASLGLVFVGQHVLVGAEPLTGGVNGRDVPGFALFGFAFEDVPGLTTYVLGVPFGREERLWYLALAVLLLAVVCFRLLVRGRVGRALRGVRDHEVAAAAMGVNVVRYKAYAFLASSMFAGLGGVLLALAFRRIIPDTFGVIMSVEYLAIIVIGGLGSAGGAVFGALFVASLPAVLERYVSQLQGSGAESGGLTSAVLAKFVYGAAVVLIIVFEPGGGSALRDRLRRRHRRGDDRPGPSTSLPLPPLADEQGVSTTERP
ncbi:branched-chain amino acid ABC transporter permease [Streptomyces sp. GC420]|uniref:branched-chain amino acid ABC transporter permease n=1 Tax=Streptomyces sp. GC420 TaxID=2697568 RepID=UPI0014150E71|nr:branched-chain amino acid ABC transporter permease [Streptomyces sp. GC420]NBM18567.1 branched-chain amino acid ABC transporter permease [Streptomyces sp. GC420]